MPKPHIFHMSLIDSVDGRGYGWRAIHKNGSVMQCGFASPQDAYEAGNRQQFKGAGGHTKVWSLPKGFCHKPPKDGTSFPVVDGHKLRVSPVFPPIPTTEFDFCASEYDGDESSPCGHGPTSEAAIQELLDHLADRGE